MARPRKEPDSTPTPRTPRAPRKAAAKPIDLAEAVNEEPEIVEQPETAEQPKAETSAGETPEQKELRELKAELARLKAAKTPAPEEAEPVAESVTIHFLDDGLTVLSAVRYRGQELTAYVGTPEYEKLQRFLEQTPTVDDQYKRWSRQRYDFGPWRGGDWLDRDDLDFGGPTSGEFPDVPVIKRPGPSIRA